MYQAVHKITEEVDALKTVLLPHEKCLTTIRREIHALEAQGVTVHRFALRGWDADIVDPLDRDEMGKSPLRVGGRTDIGERGAVQHISGQTEGRNVRTHQAAGDIQLFKDGAFVT